ncbi:ATP-binding protein, partial [Micromonospora arborensis]|uniref:sensor histidine kinase n=1 Tax=Micromonospora arborensis TaxID=2116518 RepID=UPI0034228CFF
ALAEQFSQDQSVPCDFAVSGEPRSLRPEARLALYRVAQEALTNVRRHASPTRVSLRLAYESTGTRLTVEDFADRGLVLPAETGGYGLTGMRERAELLGGTLSAGTTDHGFRVDLVVPT